MLYRQKSSTAKSQKPMAKSQRSKNNWWFGLQTRFIAAGGVIKTSPAPPQGQSRKDTETQSHRVLMFLCVSESLRLCVFNFLTLFLQGGRDYYQEQRFDSSYLWSCSLVVLLT